MMVDVIPKEKKETETPKVVKNKQNENKENIDAETILKPDDFKK